MTTTASETTNHAISGHKRRTVNDVVVELESRITKLEKRMRLLPLGEAKRADDILYGALVAYEEALGLIRTCRYRGNP